KAFGVVFLGSARSREAGEAHEVAPPMLISMAVLAFCCIAIGAAAPWVVQSLSGVAAAATGIAPPQVAAALAPVTRSLTAAVAVFAVVAVVAVLAWIVRCLRLPVA